MGKVIVKNDTTHTWAVKVTYSKLNAAAVTATLMVLGAGGGEDAGGAAFPGQMQPPIRLEDQSFLQMAKEFAHDAHVDDVLHVLSAGHASGNVSQLLNEWASDGLVELLPGQTKAFDFRWWLPGLKALTFQRLMEEDKQWYVYEVHCWTPLGSVFDKEMSVKRETDPSRTNPFYYTKKSNRRKQSD